MQFAGPLSDASLEGALGLWTTCKNEAAAIRADSARAGPPAVSTGTQPTTDSNTERHRLAGNGIWTLFFLSHPLLTRL